MILFFLAYRDVYITYFHYGWFLNLLSSFERDLFKREVCRHNASFRKKKREKYQSFLDGIMGRSIVLEESQRESIVSRAPYLLIQAGAGSGKTTTILAKIKYLIEKEAVLPTSIALISYTNETVKELRKKLSEMFSDPISVFTFHTFALSLLPVRRRVVVDLKQVLQEIIEKEFSPLERKQMYLLFSRYWKGPSFLLSYLSMQHYEKIFGRKDECLWTPFLQYAEETIVALQVDQNKVVFETEKQRDFMEKLWMKYKKYMKENGKIDFESMIEEAILVLQSEAYFSRRFTHVFVDEYQDISYNRFLLLYEYVTKTHCNVCAVGDDFQSIFAFSGSKIDLFTEFSHYFKEAEIYTITKTYRNSQALIDVAGKFIMKNPKQVYKNLISDKKESAPIYFWYYRENKIKALEKCLENIEGDTIALLGRYRTDVDFLWKSRNFRREGNRIYYQKRQDLHLLFLTVHASKGLGFDTVILLNMEIGWYGFPAERRVDKKESIVYAEERRLFYVALTRTKGKVHLLVPRDGASSFAQEILRENSAKIVCNYS